MLQYVLTINAEGIGNASEFFRKVRDMELVNLEKEVVSCRPSNVKMTFMTSYLESLNSAISSPAFVKDLRVRVLGNPDACCLVSKEGMFGGLTLNVYTSFGKMDPGTRNRLKDILQHLSATGFSSLTEFIDENMEGKAVFRTP